MRSEEHRRKFEPVDQQAADVIGRVIDRAHDLIPAAGSKPRRRRVEQRRRHRRIVDRFEQTETSDVGSMECVVVRIVARHDSPHDFAAGAREKQRSVAVLVERVFAAEKLFALDQEWRHPGRIVLVNSPGKLDEGVTFSARLDPGYFYLRHDKLISALGPPHARPK